MDLVTHLPHVSFSYDLVYTIVDWLSDYVNLSHVLRQNLLWVCYSCSFIPFYLGMECLE